MPAALRTPRGALSLLVALVLLAAYYVSAAYSAFPSAAWRVVDILVVVVIALTVLGNALDSIHVRRDRSAHLRQLPRDAITVVTAFVLMLFLHTTCSSRLGTLRTTSPYGSIWTRPPSPSSPGRASPCSAPPSGLTNLPARE